MSKVAVIGAGPAGLAAAYFASRGANSVTLFEKNEKAGKKLYITGKGRCNLTNDCDVPEFLNNVVRNSKFLYGSLSTFPPEKTIEFFLNGGLRLKTERGNRVFPLSDKASDVTKCLVDYCKGSGVDFHFNETVKALILDRDTIKGLITERERYFFDYVIVCTGGITYPSTGSTGDGFKFAASVGHDVVEAKCSLTGFNLKGDFYKSIQGLALKNVRLSAKSGENTLYSDFGELLFTHYGISGPIALTLSAFLCRENFENISLSLDLKPALDENTLDERILRDFSKYKSCQLKNALDDLLPRNLIPHIIDRSHIPPEKKINIITARERKDLVNAFKNFRMEILSMRGADEAIITSGGVNVSQLNPKTMESKLIKGLKFCGETIDVDALTGGFNIQIALSTGYIAGNSI